MHVRQGLRKSAFSRYIPLSIVFLGVVLYSLIYSLITVAKFNAYNATIFDLGVNAQTLYSVFHGGVSLIPGSRYFINTGKMIYLVLAPFYNIYPHEQVLLVFQSIWISLGALPLYFLVRKKIGDEFVAVALALAWLLYYPMAGVNWFDFHFMALFPTFFLSGIASMEYGRKRLAFAFLILSTITDFLIPLVMILYGLYLLYIDFRAGKNLWKNWVAISLITLSVAILALTNIAFGLSYTTSYAYNNATQMAAFRTDNWTIALYFARILLPLGFVSVLAPEYLALLLPFLALSSYSLYSPYTGTMFYQYPALTAPIVFIAAAKGYQRIRPLLKTHTNKITVKKIASLVLIFNFILALFLTPAGNILTNSVYNHEAGYVVSGSQGIYLTDNSITQASYDRALFHIESLIPQGSTVLAQNNLPQVAQGNTIVMPAGLLENTSAAQYPGYVLVDPYNPFFTNPVFPGDQANWNAMNAFNYLYSTGEYGVLAESQGIILLKLHYTGSPAIYSPFDHNFTLSDLRIPSDVKEVLINGTTSLEGLNGGTAWYGPYITLPPGSYNFTVSMHSGGNANWNKFN